MVYPELHKGKSGFNIFHIECWCSNNEISVEHGRRDYYKISLIMGVKPLITLTIPSK